MHVKEAPCGGELKEGFLCSEFLLRDGWLGGTCDDPWRKDLRGTLSFRGFFEWKSC